MKLLWSHFFLLGFFNFTPGSLLSEESTTRLKYQEKVHILLGTKNIYLER